MSTRLAPPILSQTHIVYLYKYQHHETHRITNYSLIIRQLASGWRNLTTMFSSRIAWWKGITFILKRNIPHLLGLKMRDIIFRLPALSLLHPAIPWSLPMYPLPVEIGIARYNIARPWQWLLSWALYALFTSTTEREHGCCRSSQYRYSLCGQHVYPIPKPEKLSERYTSRRMAFRIHSFEGFRIKRVNDTNIKKLAAVAFVPVRPMETNIRFIWTI